MAPLIFAAIIFAVGWFAHHAGLKALLFFLAGVLAANYFYNPKWRKR